MNRVRIAMAAGVVGLAGILGGCTAEQEGDLAFALLGGMAAQQGDIGAATTIEGIQRMRQAERERSNIQQNVYVPPQQTQAQVYQPQQQVQLRPLTQAEQYVKSQQQIEQQAQPLKGQEGLIEINHKDLGYFTFIVCNYFEDFDRNGKIEVPEEVIGIKNKFNKREQVVVRFGTNIEGKIDDFDLKVLDSFGKDSVFRNNEIGRDYNKDLSYGSFRKFNPGELSAGDYTAVFYYKNLFLGRLDFTIFENE